VAKIEHTYLFQPGLWQVEGVYFDGKGVRHRQTGQLVVVHGPGLWTIDSTVNISGEDTRDFQTLYEVTPPGEGLSYAEWKSASTGPEPIYGLFVVVDDVIMMPWQSRTGSYWGQEMLARVSDSEYLNRGFAFLKSTMVHSWSVRLSGAGGPGGSAVKSDFD
jgi:hypothetical protein